MILYYERDEHINANCDAVEFISGVIIQIQALYQTMNKLSYTHKKYKNFICHG